LVSLHDAERADGILTIPSQKLWFNGGEDDVVRDFKPEHMLLLGRLLRGQETTLLIFDPRLFRHIVIGFCQMVEMWERLSMTGMDTGRMYQAMLKEVFCNTIELLATDGPPQHHDDGVTLYWELLESRAEWVKDLQPSNLNNGGGKMDRTAD
jgi:hypothetical protein